MQTKPNILLVDDRSENLEALEVVLQECEASLIKAKSGDEALAMLLKHDFAMVLLDVQMPAMDGFEVAELMRLNEKTRHLPIIFVTAVNHEQKYVFKGYEVGAVDFISKPIEPHILQSKVKIFLDMWEQRNLLAQALEENERISAQLKHQAKYDDLTGLPNRNLFYDRLQQQLLESERSDCRNALMFIDLDHFKSVNDSLGHDAGDELLVQVAERLQTCVRKSDTVARIGGDEFTVILKNIHNLATTEIIADNILNSLIRPFILKQKEIHISASIGITIFPTDSRVQSELLKNADTAMYQAKSAGRNTFRYFTQQTNTEHESRRLLESQLSAALDQKEFCLHYQPKFDLSTGEITGVEALLRWQHQTKGLVYPDSFILSAEESGLMIPIGEWVLEAACRQIQAWNSTGNKNLSVSVNISPKQLDKNKSLVGMIEHLLAKTGFNPANLELEITEHLMMDNLSLAVEILTDLIKLGVNVSLDDFGTGYSSLAILKKLPIQSIKIDKSFIHDLSTNSDDAAIVQAILAMASELSISVIAEGVETKEQYQYLIEHHCREIQGYYYSRPLSAEQCTELLAVRH